MSQISSATCQESREPSSTSSRDHERAFVDIVTKNDPRIQRIVLFRDRRSKATQTTAICEVARGVQIVQISSVRHRIFLSGSSRRSEYGRARSCVSIVSVTCEFCSTPRLYHETLSCRHAADERSNRWLFFCLIDHLDDAG